MSDICGPRDSMDESNMADGGDVSVMARSIHRGTSINLHALQVQELRRLEFAMPHAVLLEDGRRVVAGVDAVEVRARLGMVPRVELRVYAQASRDAHVRVVCPLWRW
jgi:hypothetical protein